MTWINTEYQDGKGRMPKFSVLTSSAVVHSLRVKQLQRCIDSISNQSFKDYEHIIVNDGSADKYWDELVFSDKVKTIKQKHRERVVALNKAFKKASGEWLVFLDADDEFFSYTLEVISQMIDKSPKLKMFNYASYHVNKNYFSRIRGAFKPKKKKKGHEVFGGGNIVNGTFVFHRSVYEKLGGFPEDGKIKDPSGNRDFLYMNNPWDFSIAAQMEFPEIKPYFRVKHPDHPEGKPKELGNPWGNDFYMFYKYTREYHSKVYDIPLLIVHGDGKHPGDDHQL